LQEESDSISEEAGNGTPDDAKVTVKMINKSATRIVGFAAGRSGLEIPD
jgi:hypothetical protein